MLTDNFKKNDCAKAKDLIRMVIEKLKGSNNIKDIFETYKKYHSDYNDRDLNRLMEVHGQTSSTEFRPYYVAKVKIDRLIGEAMEIKPQLSVESINPTAINKKMEKVALKLANSYNQPFLQEVDQNVGANPIGNIPQEPFEQTMQENDPIKIKSENEIVMGRLLQKKQKELNRKLYYYQIFRQGMFTSAMFSKIVGTRNGGYTLEIIPTERVFFFEELNDIFLEKTPVIGYWSNMFENEIYSYFNIDANSEEAKQIAALFNSTDSTNGFYMFDDGSWADQIFMKNSSSANKTVTVVQVEFKALEKRIVYLENGQIRIASYNRKNIKKAKENGQFKVVYNEVLWEGACIAGKVFVNIQKKENYVKQLTSTGHYKVEFDIIGTLINNFGGKRTSFAKVALNLGEMYDKYRWLIYREAKKTRGAAIYLKKEYFGKKTQSQILYDLEESGVVVLDPNDRAEDETFERPQDMIGSFNIQGVAQNLQQLVNIALDIERIIDLTTGMNEARQGMEKATTTATTSQNNLKASRSATFYLFAHAELHMEHAFSRLLQKTKQAIIANSIEGKSFLNTEDINLLKETVDFTEDDFTTYVTDGRRTAEILQALDTNVIPVDINAGKITSADYLAYKQAESLAEAQKVLANAQEQYSKQMQEQEKQKQESQEKMNQEKLEAAKEDREDRQAHEIQIEKIRQNATARSEKIRSNIELQKLRASMEQTRLQNNNKKKENE